jgi:hypothetical protein
MLLMRSALWLVAAMAGLMIGVNMARAELPALRVDGTTIVNERGEKVQLRGVNLGGWLVEEMWMMPFHTHPPQGSDFAEVKDHVSLWRTIEKRLGKDAAVRVRTALRNAWVDESDFDRMKEAGFNCVRLPFLAALLDEKDGLEWLEKTVGWAEKRGMYVILDLHGAPGCQSKDHHSGESDRNEFFKKWENVQKGEAVWKTVAAKFKGRKSVAGYDLLNEPMGAPNLTTLAIVHDRLYRAVRSVDADHIVFVEDGYKGLDSFPAPASVGWTNVAYSLHFYGFQSKSAGDQVAKMVASVAECEKAQVAYGVPMYLGEFNQEPHGTRETMQGLIAQFVGHGWPFTIWTYKIVMPGGTHSMWGYFRNPHKAPAINPFTDSEAEMIAKMAEYRTEKLQADPRLVGVIGSH